MTSCPHTDAERAAAGCPVCLQAELDALANASSDIAPWQDAAKKLNELPSLPSLGDVAELIKEACLACAKGWRDHAAESDNEFLQLEDWLIGNAEHNKDGSLRNRAEACRERIRDLIAAEAERDALRECVQFALANLKPSGGPIWKRGTIMKPWQSWFRHALGIKLDTL